MTQQLDIHGNKVNTQVLDLVYYSLPSHGYLKVSHELLRRIVKDVTLITKYSGIDRNNVYLEHDKDASTFLNAAESAGYEVKIDSRCIENKHFKTHNYDPQLVATEWGRTEKKKTVRARQIDLFPKQIDLFL